MKTIVPIGTSRVHWPLEYLKKYSNVKVDFLKVGYFQSAGQVNDLLFNLGRLRESDFLKRYFFRIDSSKTNRFDGSVFKDTDFLTQLEKKILSADFIYLEISTLVEFVYKGLHLQGNPNYYRNIPFNDIWKEGYYRVYEPGLNVVKYNQQYDYIFSLLDKIKKSFDCELLVTTHIFERKNPYGREEIYKIVSRVCEKLGLKFFDKTSLVEKYGFRESNAGDKDIHHLSWLGTKNEAININEFLGLGDDNGFIDSVLKDREIESHLK